MKRTLVFATNNAHKLEEMRAIVGSDITILSLHDIQCHAEIPETADTFQGNALQKARYITENFGLDCFADDSGLEVDALGGAPGVFTARYAGDAQNHNSEANMDKLLNVLAECPNRKARFRTVIALILQGETHFFEGTVNGVITTTKQGTQGFGYDPIFMPDGYNQTFAELGEEIKNGISHRARAAQQLVTFLKKQ